MRVRLLTGIAVAIACNGVTTPEVTDAPSAGDLPDADVAIPLTETTPR